MICKHSVLAIALTSTALTTLPAHAQSGQVPPASASEDGRSDQATNIGDVVVTAQRRSEALVDVPISITSVSAQTLDRSNVEGIIDLAKVTPGLVTNRFGVAVQPAIRGVTTRLGENSVATYIDGFYIPNAVSLNFDFNNIQRVDVLKGPQGTLFGRNATGGAIVVTTRDPSHNPSARIELGAEELGGRRASFYGTTGLTDTIAVDLAADYRTSDGYIYNVTGGDPINNTEHRNVRGRVLWQPSEALKLTATAEYGYLEDATTAASFTFYENRRLAGSIEKNVISANHKPENSAEWQAYYLKGEYDFGSVALTSYTSWRRDTNDLDVDLDGSATVEAVNVVWRTDQKTFQQEFNLASTGDGPLSWVAGLYYFNDDYRRNDIPGNIIGVPTTAQITTTTEAASVFGDLSYAATEALTLTFGARYNAETKTGSFRTPLDGTATTFNRGEADYSNVSPRAIARYALDADSNIFASWSRGFKSGTFNTTAVTVAPTDPEQLDAYEVGYKISKSRFSFDAAAFYYDWQDIQVARFDPTIPGGNIIFNAAAAEIYGAEAQVTWRATDRLTLRANGAYTHGEYTDFPDAIVSAPSVPGSGAALNVTTVQDWSGTQLIRAPEFTANLGLDYVQPTSIGEFQLSANVYYTSDYLPNTARENALTGQPDLAAPAYALVNLTATYAPTDRLTLSAYARNLFDKSYLLATDASAYGTWRLYGEPRVIGVKAALSF